MNVTPQTPQCDSTDGERATQTPPARHGSGLVASICALCGFTLRQILGQRKLALALAILLCPTVVVVLVRGFGHGRATRETWEMYHFLMQFVLLMLLMPLIAMLYGTAVIGAEVEQRTLAYLTTRRLHRGSLLLVRFSVTWFVVSALYALAMLALHASVTLNAPEAFIRDTHTPWAPARDLCVYLVLAPAGAAAFLAVFTLISLLSSRPLIVATIYVAVFELVLGNLPAPVQRLSINHPLRQFLAEHIPGGREFYKVPAALVTKLFPAGESGLWTLLGITALFLSGAGLLITFRELVPARSGRE